MNKKDFPLLATAQHSNKKLFFLDNAATTHKPADVVEAVCRFYTTSNANVGRGLYPLAEEATWQYEWARKRVAKFIGAQPKEIVFTSGTTESINFVAQAFARETLQPGDEILLTRAEHHANLLPWQRVCEQTGAQLRFIPIDTQTFKASFGSSIVSKKTKLLAVTLDSNVLGNIWDSDWENLKMLIQTVKAQGGFVLLDAAQAVAHHRVDLSDFNADFICFSGHKLFGPTGVGVLYINTALHNRVQPYQVGGSMIKSVSFQSATFATPPQKFEAGTPPIADAIGLAAAIDYLQTIDFTALTSHEAALCQQFITRLQSEIPEAVIIGNVTTLATAGHLVCFYLPDIHAHDIAGYLAQEGVAVRAGNLCAQPLIDLLGGNALVRMSVALYNDRADIDACIEALKKAVTFFTRARI